jgi:hypothetical protein
MHVKTFIMLVLISLGSPTAAFIGPYAHREKYSFFSHEDSIKLQGH